jgi:hypothetical protein
MNMPFECGLDFGLRNSNIGQLGKKKFLIFEQNKYDLKKSLSDIAGQDPEFHDGNFQILITKIRNFFSAKQEITVAGPSKIFADYIKFQTWILEKKIEEGHSENEALNLPTKERIDAMQEWVKSYK